MPMIRIHKLKHGVKTIDNRFDVLYNKTNKLQNAGDITCPVIMVQIKSIEILCRQI